MTLRQPLHGKPLDENGTIEFEQKPAMTHTEVKEFLERMPELRKLTTNSVDIVSCFLYFIEALDVIDFLLAKEQQIRREAFLEAAREVCDWCRTGKLLVTNPLIPYYRHHWKEADDPREHIFPCRAYQIHRKLAEEVKG